MTDDQEHELAELARELLATDKAADDTDHDAEYMMLDIRGDEISRIIAGILESHGLELVDVAGMRITRDSIGFAYVDDRTL